MLECTQCNLCIDRDVNASRNILAKAYEKGALRFGAVGGAGEAMMAVKRCRVDAPQLISPSGG